MLAIKGGFVNVVEILLETGGHDVGMCDKDGNTALHYACESGNVDIVNVLLVDNMENINVCNNNGHTPLDIATFMEHHSIVEAILMNSSNTDQTPLMQAAKQGLLEEMRHDTSK